MYDVGASELAAASASAARCCSAAAPSARILSFSWCSAANRFRRRCTMNTANPTQSSTTSPRTYHGQTSRDFVVLITTTAMARLLGAADEAMTDDGAADDTTGMTAAELAAAVEAAVDDAGVDGALVLATTGAVTSKEATPVTLEVWPTALSRCVPGGRS